MLDSQRQFNNRPMRQASNERTQMTAPQFTFSEK